LTFAGFMHYHIPFWPHNIETFKEGVFGALTILISPYVFFWVINKFIPSIKTAEN
jgi:hypothetical protein